MQPIHIIFVFLMPIAVLVGCLVYCCTEWVTVIIASWLGVQTVCIMFLAIVLVQRHLLSNAACFQKYSGFWTRSDYTLMNKRFWIDAWLAYSCKIDSRLMKPKSHVYYIFATYCITYIGAIACIVANMNSEFRKVMLLHLLSFMVYFVTMLVEKFRTTSKSK